MRRDERQQSRAHEQHEEQRGTLEEDEEIVNYVSVITWW
jgi:hypothetical protein